MLDGFTANESEDVNRLALHELRLFCRRSRCGAAPAKSEDDFVGLGNGVLDKNIESFRVGCSSGGHNAPKAVRPGDPDPMQTLVVDVVRSDHGIDGTEITGGENRDNPSCDLLVVVCHIETILPF